MRNAFPGGYSLFLLGEGKHVNDDASSGRPVLEVTFAE